MLWPVRPHTQLSKVQVSVNHKIFLTVILSEGADRLIKFIQLGIISYSERNPSYLLWTWKCLFRNLLSTNRNYLSSHFEVKVTEIITHVGLLVSNSDTKIIFGPWAVNCWTFTFEVRPIIAGTTKRLSIFIKYTATVTPNKDNTVIQRFDFI